MFNIMKGTASTLNEENRYELQNHAAVTIQSVNPVRYGQESLSYLGPKCWETLLLDLKKTKSLSKFKAEIKKRNPKNRLCRHCKTYLQYWFYLSLRYKIETF